MPDPALQGLWDWRSPFYLAIDAESDEPLVQPHVIDFLKGSDWADFIKEYHRDVAFKGLLPALIPSFPIFKADYKTDDGSDGQGGSGGNGGTGGGKPPARLAPYPPRPDHGQDPGRRPGFSIWGLNRRAIVQWPRAPSHGTGDAMDVAPGWNEVKRHRTPRKDLTPWIPNCPATRPLNKPVAAQAWSDIGARRSSQD